MDPLPPASLSEHGENDFQKWGRKTAEIRHQPSSLTSEKRGNSFFRKMGKYYLLFTLMGSLKVAKVKGVLEAELKKIEKCPLLILDDSFLVALDAKERAILIEIIEDRHERKSIIISSQLPVSSWYDAIGDPTAADAILDRIVHTAHQIELSGESLRKIKARKGDK